MTEKMKNSWWIFWQFAWSNFHGFPGGNRWLRRLRGTVCNSLHRFSPDDFEQFLLLSREKEGGSIAARLGGCLAGLPGALAASAGLVFPWILVELISRGVLLQWGGWFLVPMGCLLLRGAAAGGALLEALELEPLVAAGGILDAVFGWIPPELVLLAAVVWQGCRGWRALERRRRESIKKEVEVI